MKSILLPFALLLMACFVQAQFINPDQQLLNNANAAGTASTEISNAQRELEERLNRSLSIAEQQAFAKAQVQKLAFENAMKAEEKVIEDLLMPMEAMPYIGKAQITKKDLPNFLVFELGILGSSFLASHTRFGGQYITAAALAVASGVMGYNTIKYATSIDGNNPMRNSTIASFASMSVGMAAVINYNLSQARLDEKGDRFRKNLLGMNLSFAVPVLLNHLSRKLITQKTESKINANLSFSTNSVGLSLNF